MELSSMMAAQVGQLQQTVGMSMLKMATATQAAGTIVMLDDFAKAQASTAAPQAAHPYLGKSLDVRV